MSTKPVPPTPISALEEPKPESISSAPPPTSIDELALAAKEQYDTLQKQAISALLSQQKEISAKLLRLGYTPVPAKTHGATPITVGSGLGQPCRVCGELGHDARRHRKDNIAAIARGKRPPRK